MLLGFELLLARVECYHLLQLLEKDQLGPQEWLDVLQRKVGPTKMDEATEKKTTVVQMEEEEKKKEEADVKDVPLYLDNRLEVKPQPKPGRCHLNSVDQSIIEMEKSYPDLAFRGRLLLPHKPQRANSSKSSSKDVHLPSINDYSDVSKAAELPKKDCIKGTRVNATTVHSKDDGIKADEVLGDDGRGIGCNDRNSGGTTAPGDTMSSSSSTSTNTSTTDGSRVHDELSEPQAVSLHIILRAGSKAEQSLKPGEPHPTAEPPARTQQTVADLQNKRAANPKTPSLCSMDEEQELIELAERMDQLHVQGEEVKRKKKHKIEEENTNKERRKKGRKASTERESEEQNIRMEAGPALSHAASRCTRSSQSDPVLMKEQPDVCHHSPLSISAAEHQSCEGGSTGQQQGEDTVRGEEEQLAQSFVIVEHHKK
ncbi:uncharacterized protein LOC115019783 [Cottoperca gobio]|uniref:Uncharacterized protein LOC115019783 n=1 Tax=Cottoperca gobio TaxID=56716 RepID=A0A6J2R4Q0_COTGO|nr:uncharacterized protein LOC115019783 [Cottoperca gobio]